MKIFYKYIFCLLVYVISFASTNPFAPFDKNTFTSIYGEVSLPDSVKLTFGDGSGEVREGINNNECKTTQNKCKTIPMSIHQWEHASFDEVLKEVVPSVLFMNNGTRGLGEDYFTEYNDVKNKISETMMKIANGEAKGGHIAVARVILDDNKVIPLPYFFLSGKTVGRTIDTLGLYVEPKEAKVKKIKLKEEYFFNIWLGDISCDGAAAGIPHSERAIGLYLQKNMRKFLPKIKLIQIKNASPMCGDCVLFWQNMAHNANIKRNDTTGNTISISREFCAQDKGVAYNVWDGYEINSILRCSNYVGDGVSIGLKDLKCFTKINYERGPLKSLPNIIINKEIGGAKKRKTQ